MYELHLDGFIIKNEDLSELTKIVQYNPTTPYDIFDVRQSAMNAPGFMPSNLTDKQRQRIREQYKRGYAMKTLGDKYGVSENTISRVLKTSTQIVD